MKVAVRYYSRSGNTKKLAEAISQAVGVPAASTDTKIEGPVDLLFLGAALYAGRLDGHVVSFLEQLSAKDVRRVAVFSTTAGGKSAYPQIKEILEKKNIDVKAQQFHCKGKFLMAHRSHPDAQDCQEAAKFAKSLCQEE